jgi:hypothetical protein
MAKTWINTVQNCYPSKEDLESYDKTYNVCFRAGYTGINRVRQMWDDNKIIGGSVYPEDFGLASAKDIASVLLPEYQEAVEFTESGLDRIYKMVDYVLTVAQNAGIDLSSKTNEEITLFALSYLGVNIEDAKLSGLELAGSEGV